MFPMKNKYCIYLLLVLPFLSVAQALQGSVIYKKEPVASEKHIGPIVFVSNKPIKSVYDALRYELKFNAKEALFSMIDNMERDDNRFNSYVFRSGGGNGTYYTSLDCNYSLRQVEYIGELFLVKMDHPTFTITNETKIIGNYECRQAIVTGINKAPNKDLKDTRYTYSVWFTPDIPVALGPIHFDGFPGLVLAICGFSNVSLIDSNIKKINFISLACKTIGAISNGYMIFKISKQVLNFMDPLGVRFA